MINFKDLGFETKIETTSVQVNDTTNLDVRTYLPMQEKVVLIDYVINHALDEKTGRFSPIRIGLFFDLAVAHFYGGINFEDDVMALDAYDTLETNGILGAIVAAIPSDEYNYIKSLVDETAKDIADYNSSFAGVMQIAGSETSELGTQIQDIINKVQNREGLELLSEIKNVVGTD